MTLSFAPPIPDTPTINVVLLGPPKIGKSTGAASAPGPVLYVNADLPTATRYVRHRYGEKVQEVVFEGMTTLIDVTHEVNDPKTKFKTVVVDTIGELHRLLLEEESKGAIRPSLNQYGDVGVNIERFCRAMCKAPVNAVLVCHDNPVKNEETGEVMQLPWTGTTNPKLGRALMGMADIVAFAGVVQQEGGGRRYLAQLVTAKGRPGGDRFDILADEGGGVRGLDLSEWVEAIHANEKAEKAEKNGGQKAAQPENKDKE